MLLLRVLLGHGRSTVRSWEEHCQVMGGVLSGLEKSVHGGVMSRREKEYCQVMGGVMSRREKSTVRSWG